MTFHTFSITFISGDCAGHVKLEIWCSFFHRRVNNERCTGALSSWKMNCLPAKFLHTTGHKFLSSTFNIYESQHFRQLVPKYPLIDNKYNPRTLQIFCDTCHHQDIPVAKLSDFGGLPVRCKFSTLFRHFHHFRNFDIQDWLTFNVLAMNCCVELLLFKFIISFFSSAVSSRRTLDITVYAFRLLKFDVVMM